MGGEIRPSATRNNCFSHGEDNVFVAVLKKHTFMDYRK